MNIKSIQINPNIRPLTESELAEIWENWSSESEDGLDFSDTDSVADPNYVPSDADISDNVEDNADQDLEDISSDVCSSEGEENIEPEDQSEPVLQKVSVKKKKVQKRDVVCKHRGMNLNDPQLAFHGNTDLPPEVMALETPYSFFPIFFLMALLPELLKRVTYMLLN
ncbi:hypothetical protein NQ314_017834 [Rhamnusium bicolor]|uniref:Uncharacterized protein n=1 Tax=Rhamnusium bicolor TaxID=1586634 RepID=A0AAV8WRV1_9CUCU|nr:hypothetical protein NQ314_017834 [Rhamnusium bicolor]